jgi:hypothetical protein
LTTEQTLCNISINFNFINFSDSAAGVDGNVGLVAKVTPSSNSAYIGLS